MGKGRRTRGRQQFGKRANGAGPWTDIPKENEKWENYYKAQELIPEDEWQTFHQHCQSQLPLTFRITGSRSHADEIKQVFKTKHLPSLLDESNLLSVPKEEIEQFEKPKNLSWYPNELAWQLNIPKSVMKKNEIFKKTQRFLVIETEVGNISRQEAVSMIPPLLLDVQSHHYVLDMCAAPGSKTAQLVEKLHEDSPNDIPKGFVMANDSDYRRSHMLVHQVKRLNSPNFIVVNHDGQMMPKFKLDANTKTGAKFDRILCDVPCTGDGTMRKNVTVWKEWNIGNGLGLHSLQLNILNRGLQMLKPGGRLVYSTCSLNPIENEAVIAGALKKWGAQIKLVDVSNELKGLIRRDGVNSWKLYNKKGELVKDEEHLKELQKDNFPDNKISLTCFPPTEEEAKNYHLERCVRIYPHLQNTGGFFITVIEKIPQEPVNPKKRNFEENEAVIKKPKIDNEEDEEEEIKVDAPVVLKKEKLPRDANEEPFIFLDSTLPLLEKCWSLYDIDANFPKDCTLVRNATGEPIRSVYFVAPIIKKILTLNENKLKFIHSGIKLFVAQKQGGASKGEVSWRLQNESLVTLKPFIGDSRLISLKEPEILKILLLETFPVMTELREISPDFCSQIDKIDGEGCCFLTVLRDEGEDIYLPIWKGKVNINLMLNKHDTFELLYRIFGVETDRNTTYKQDKNGNNSKIGIVESKEYNDESKEGPKEGSKDSKEDLKDTN